MNGQIPLAVVSWLPQLRQLPVRPGSGLPGLRRRAVTRPGADGCPVCAQQPAPDGQCLNELCRSPGRRIGRIHAIGYQAGPLRRCINSYKYRGTRSWSVVLGRLLLGWLDETMAGDRPDLIVANPGFTGPGGQQFAHAEAVLAAAAAASAVERSAAGPGRRGRSTPALRPRLSRPPRRSGRQMRRRGPSE